MTSNPVGMRPAQALRYADPADIEILIPPEAIGVIRVLRPDLLSEQHRLATLEELISMDSVADTARQRSALLRSIPQDHITQLVKRTGLSASDLRTREHLTKGQRQNFLGYFGAADQVHRARPVIDPFTAIHPEHGLFDHQKRVAMQAEEHLNRHPGRVIMHLPTGVGKTRTAMSIVASHLRNRQRGLVLWLANRTELLEQAVNEFEKSWAKFGDRSVILHRFWSNSSLAPESLVKSGSDGVFFASVAKLHHYSQDGPRMWRFADLVTMIVFDEAHQSIAPTYRELVEKVVTRGLSTPFLGLTATPGRTWNEPDTDETLATFFGENKVTLDFEGRNPIASLTQEGYLASATFSQLQVTTDFVLESNELEALRSSSDVPDHVLEKLGQDVQRTTSIVETILNLSERHRRILVFAPSVGSARLLCQLCRLLDLSSDALFGATTSRERGRIIRDFKRNDNRTRVLINFGVLTAGFDAPMATAAVIARPTKSLVLYSQMVGRVIRGPQAGGTPECHVVTVVDTALPGFRNVYEAFTNWEDIWNTTD